MDKIPATGGIDGCQRWRHGFSEVRLSIAMDTMPSKADIKVLALVDSRTATLGRRLVTLAAQTAPAGIAVEVLGELDDLPVYDEDMESADMPNSAIALRIAAAEADAALVLTPGCRGSIPSALRNAIDWLTPPGHSELHDKPLAVIGAAVGRYVGVWSHPAGRDVSGEPEPHIVEQITVDNLGDMVSKLAAEVGGARLLFALDRSA